MTATPAGPGFDALGVRRETLDALRKHGIERPFAIQELTIPLALSGADVIGQARTGTGKTLAFGIPLLQRVLGPSEGADGRPQALAVVPTRELCIQVTEDIRRAGADRGIRVLSVYGGRAYEPQVSALAVGVEIVVGTPGRLLDLARQRSMNLSHVGALVLDEADEMLDLGFLPDVERIIDLLPARQQTMLFSATMPGPVISLARRFMNRPVHVTAEQPDEGRTVPTTAQHVFRAHALDKAEMLARILQAKDRALAIVFVRTKRTADKVAEDLTRRGFAAAAVHGDLGQGQREQALRAFRAGKIDVMVATDVAARGIDVGGVTHVINYQCPEDDKVYLHRIGRTGRAGGSGVAVTFVDWDDLPRWSLVNEALRLPFPEPPETYSTSVHLREALDIPEGVTGILPTRRRTRAGLAAEEVEDIGETGRHRRKAPAEAPSTPSSPPARRARARRRTRGAGAALGAAAVADGQDEPAGEVGPIPAGAPTAPVTAVAGVAGSPSGADDGTGDGPTGSMTAAGGRRRRRGGRGRRRGGEAAANTDPTADGTQAESA